MADQPPAAEPSAAEPPAAELSAAELSAEEQAAARLAIEAINDHEGSRPGVLSWSVAGATLIAVIVFLVMF